MGLGLVKVTSKNSSQISKYLENGDGRLLIYEPSVGFEYNKNGRSVPCLMGDAHFKLFGNAKIRDEDCISMFPVNHSDSREYHLRKRIPSGDAIDNSGD